MVKPTDMSAAETVETLLYANWGKRLTRIQALPSGHTNKTYLIHCGPHPSVLRISWPGKSAMQVRREASVLSCLKALPGLPALPRMQPTLTAQTCLQDHDGCWLHLFEHIGGSPGLPDDTAKGIANAMRTLAHLHTAMATIPASDASPIAWLQERYERVANRPAPTLPSMLPKDYALLLQSIGMHLAKAATWVPGPVRWLHGDYHAGNLLFIDQTVNGVIDFDEVGQGSHLLEAAFALFALTRDTTVEHRFDFDAESWDTHLCAYAQIQPGTPMDGLRQHRDALMYLFCADQTLIHLEAAQRGLWVLGPGIGFLACWHQLLASLLPAL